MKYSMRSPGQHLSIDGVRVSQPLKNRPHQILRHSSRSAPVSTPTKKPHTPSRAKIPNSQVAPQAQSPKKIRRKVLILMQVLLALPVLLVAGFAIQSAFVGQLLILVYGSIAFIFRIPSQTTFSLALIAMIGTIILASQGNESLAQIFASYTFLLLVVGVFTLSRELKKEGGRVYNSRYNRHL